MSAVLPEFLRAISIMVGVGNLLTENTVFTSEHQKNGLLLRYYCRSVRRFPYPPLLFWYAAADPLKGRVLL